MSAPRDLADAMRRWRLAPAVATLVALTACGSAPPTRTPAPPPPAPAAAPKPAARAPADKPAADRSTPEKRSALAEGLATEQRWLQSWFKGTPVLIAQRDEGTLAVDVPREFCFDAGKSGVKPALAAVLDKVAESLRRRPAAQLLLVAAPGDAGVNGASGANAANGASGALAVQRAAQVQKHLRDRGVAAARLAAPAAARGAAVQLRIGMPQP